MKTSSQVVLCLLGVTQARVSAGTCHAPAAVQDIDTEALKGDWYPIYGDSQELAGSDPSCIKLRVSLAKNWW